jgi:amino acid adenylation domain-containing protein
MVKTLMKLSNSELKQFLIDAKRRNISFVVNDGRLTSKAPEEAIRLSDRDVIKGNKEALIQLLSDTGLSRKIQPQMSAENELVLSSAQSRLWFIDKLQGSTSQYNMPIVLRYGSKLDIGLLTDVFTSIIQRHKVLRTVYRDKGSEVLQHVIPMSEVRFSIDVHDLTQHAYDIESSHIQKLIASEIDNPFNLQQDLMLRVTCFKVSEGTKVEGVLVLNMHHIASDGWSIQILMKEFFILYSAYLTGNTSPLPELEVQYSDYAYWQHNILKTPVLNQQLGYWQVALQELPPQHRLPLKSERPVFKQRQGAKVIGHLGTETKNNLTSLAKRHQLTIFMLLHGALALILSRHTNDSDVIIGTPVANRLHDKVEPLIGCFVNTLVLRLNTQKETLREYFNHVKQVHLEAQSNQDVPFELLVDVLKVPRSTSYSPLFQIMLTTNTDFEINENSLLNSASSLDLDIKPYLVYCAQTKFDLDIDINISDEGIAFTWLYDISLFTEEYVTQLNRHLCNLLDDLGAYKVLAESHPAQLKMLSEQEQEHLVNGLNNSSVDFPAGQLIHELFESQVKKTPDTIALSFEGTDLTFSELNSRANQLARYLVDVLEVRPTSLIGIFTERSIGMVVGMLAVFKAGAAYLPLEPSLPQERIRYMIEDSETKLILTHKHIQPTLEAFEGTVLLLDELDYEPTAEENYFYSRYSGDNIESVRVDLKSTDLAYVFYTSGSTGRPKGTLNSHGGLVNRLHTLQHQFRMQYNDKILQKTQISFDVSLGEILWPLTSGGRLILAKPGGHTDPKYLTDVITAQGITIIHFVPSMLQLFINNVDTSKLKSLRLIMTSGEALSYELQKQTISAFENVELVNQYGPTEAAIEVSYWNFNKLREDKRVPIGYPSANMELHIIDRHGNLVPQGVEGELYIAGCQVGMGYLKQDKLTAERFVTLKLLGVERRAYRTGDLGRWLSDGTIEFLGRMDSQIKLRGVRIELGEIESRLREIETVTNAVVVAKGALENQVLCAYVEVNQSVENEADFVSELRYALQLSLPPYMIPNAISIVTTFPLSANGKVDRLALMERAVPRRQRVAAKNEVEKVILDIWSKALGLQLNDISIDDNFFEIGGNSLSTISVCKEINHRLETSLLIADLFQYPSIRLLSQFLRKVDVKKVDRKVRDGAKERIILARNKFNRNKIK